MTYGEHPSSTAAAAEDKLWNSDYLKVMCSNFLLFFAFYLIAPLLPLYLNDRFMADKDTIGIVLSGYVVATLMIRPFSGFMVDSFNRKKVLMLCFFVFFICFAGYIGAGTLLMFAIVRTMHGIPFGAATVANSTVAIDVLPSSRRNEGIGFYGLSNNLAMAIAPSAGIYIYSVTGDFPMLFWISLILALAGFICTSRVRIPTRELIKNKPKMSLDHFFLGRAWLMAVNITLFGLCWGIMSNYVAIYEGRTRCGRRHGHILHDALRRAVYIATLWFQVAACGQNHPQLRQRRTAVTGRLHTLRPRIRRVELLPVSAPCRPRQRSDVPGIS